MNENNKLNEPDSFLGIKPECDICCSPLQAGDKVKQIFVGIVTLSEAIETDGVVILPSELGIIEQSYTVIHVDCENRIKVN